MTYQEENRRQWTTKKLTISKEKISLIGGQLIDNELLSKIAKNSGLMLIAMALTYSVSRFYIQSSYEDFRKSLEEIQELKEEVSILKIRLDNLTKDIEENHTSLEDLEDELFNRRAPRNLHR